MTADVSESRPPTRVLLDTNTLVAVSDPSRTNHSAANAVVNQWPAQGTTLHTTTQVIREYLVVATRPDEVSGLGLSMDEALSNVVTFRARIEVLEESRSTLDRLVELITTTSCPGKQIHDANIVATMLTHGIGSLVTDNVRDFARFGDQIEVIPLR